MPNTLKQVVDRVKAATTAIGNAITAKGGTVGVNDGLEDFASDIASIPSGGGSAVEEKDVNFYDYDGTIVNSYTASEFANLSTFPDNPSHDGLTAQGWNWDTLANAKAYVASYGKLNIGQMYASNTPNGVTLLHIRLSKGRLKPYLGLTGNSNGTVVSIDWGDNSTVESVILDTSTIYTPHEYVSDGAYIISISVTNGTVSLNGTSTSTDLFRKSSSANAANDRVYANILTKAEIGIGVTSIGQDGFSNCASLTSITLPLGLTSITNNAFQNCISLTSITLPLGLTSIGSLNGASLKSITLPSTLTSIQANFLLGCASLTSITIPSSVTSIGNYAFQNCTSLTSITLPVGLINIEKYAFYYCTSLTSITLPSTLTSIQANAFGTNVGLGFIKFSSTTPPNVINSNAWFNLPTDCIIYVPTGSLSAYTSANNYPSSSTYTYVEY